MKQIPLTRGYFALVDDEDFERLNLHKWRVQITPRNKYAVRQYRQPGNMDKRIFVSMHRTILGLVNGNILDCDHKDGNGLNNQKYNLRKCTRSQNLANRRPNVGKSLKGVHKRTRNGSVHWHTYCLGKWCGSFKTELESAKAYNDHLLRHRGKFALLNTV